MSHARVMPSKLHLTVPCPGSLQLQEEAAKRSSPPITRDQAEGELGHIVARKHAEGAGAEWPVGRKVHVGRHEFEIDDDMVDGAIIYMEEAQANGRFEDPVSIPDIPECFGTPDWWRVLVDLLKQLKVIDYKYGHRFVEVFEHYQLLAYASGIARTLNLPFDFPVVLCIVQPRNYTHGTIREWKTTVGEIYKLVAAKIAPRVALALGPNPPTVAGRHCLDCAARHLCKTLTSAAADAVDYSATAELQDIPNWAVGQELRILKDAKKILEARYDGLHEHALAAARTEAIPHWSIEPGAGSFKWKEGTPHEHLALMGDLMGVNLRKPLKLITPTQAIQAGIDKKAIDSYAHRPAGALRLVPDDTTRTRKIFGGNKT
jgi:hypothetical protein